MTGLFRSLAAGGVLIALSATSPALAQKQGGILRQYMIDSPASMSIHEEATIYAQRPIRRP
jgi:peptide/nickel transport system substrate-binding protein